MQRTLESKVITMMSFKVGGHIGLVRAAICRYHIKENTHNLNLNEPGVSFCSIGSMTLHKDVGYKEPKLVNTVAVAKCYL